MRTKITRAPCRRCTGEALPRAEKFGDLITADHKVLNEGCESRDNHLYAIVVQDLATRWIQSYPCNTHISQDTEKSSKSRTRVHTHIYSTHIDLDVLHAKRIDDCWNVDSSKHLSNSWKGFMTFTPTERETSKRIFVVWGETDKDSNDNQTRTCMA